MATQAWNIDVQLHHKHLRDLAERATPIGAIEELIWNALDADATTVNVAFEVGELDGLNKITITDDGDGIRPEHVEQKFGNLGGSPKREQRISDGRRTYHGKRGEGRFKAFALGHTVSWQSTTISDLKPTTIRITSNSELIHQYKLEYPVQTEDSRKGTVVTVADLCRDLGILKSPQTRVTLTERLALYLSRYPDCSVWYDGARIDPNSAVIHKTNFAVKEFTFPDGDSAVVEIKLIEWKGQERNSMLLCTAEGFVLRELQPGVPSPGHKYSVYVQSDYIERLYDCNVLELIESDGRSEPILTHVKDQIRTHYKKRKAAEARRLIEDWIKQDVYPYTKEVSGDLERREREVFDLIAINVHELSPAFKNADAKNKKFQFQ